MNFIFHIGYLFVMAFTFGLLCRSYDRERILWMRLYDQEHRKVDEMKRERKDTP
jgi:hypothetical protein